MNRDDPQPGHEAGKHAPNPRDLDGLYQTLFNSVDQGFCLVEVLFEQGKPRDYHFLEVNQAFARHTGLANAQGKRMRELAPEHEQYWFDIYGEVARTGQPVRFTNRAAALGNRWFEVYAFRFGQPQNNRVAILFSDSSDRKRAEDELRHAYSLIEGITAGTEDLIAAVDGNYKFLYFNEAYRQEFKKLWGHDIRIGSSLVDALAPWPEQQAKARELWSRGLAGETFSIVTEFGPGEGNSSIYDLRFNPIRGRDGSILGAAHIFRDVTQQVQFQQTLRESDERYRLISRAINDVIWDWNLLTDRVEWNEAVVEHFGCSRDEMGSGIDSWYNRIHPDDAERVIQGIHAAIDTGARSWNDEYRFRKPDGSYATFLDRGHIAHDRKGRPYRMIGSMLDLTERRRAEETLQRAADADALRVALSDAVRPQADPVATQREAARVLGEHLKASRVHYAEVSQDGEYGVVHACYHPRACSTVGRHRFDDFGAQITADLRAGQTIVVNDVQSDHRLSDAERNTSAKAEIAAHIAVPLVKAGRALAVFAVHQSHPRNWTENEVALVEETAERTWAAVERARAEEALRVSEQRFRLLTDGIPHVVWLIDAEGRFEFLNRQFTAYTGVEPEGFEAGDFVERFIHPDDRAATLSAWTNAIEERRPLQIQHRLVSAAGDYRWFTTRAEPHIDRASGKVLRWYGTMTDVHDQKVAEETLLEADRQKDEFLAMLAHELRNPLAAVRYVERLLDPVTRGNSNAEYYMNILRRQTATLTELVDELLDVSRITRGLVELKKRGLDLVEVAQRALETVQPLMAEKGHQVGVHLPDAPVEVLGDAVRLEQALVNLLTNAAKYTDPGGDVSLALRTRDGRAEIRVRDTGIGMTPQVIEQVFTLFGQAEQGLDRSLGGLGIGLTIARNLVELHGGSISAHSDGPGRGAEFVVTLPLMPQEAATQAPSAAPTKGRAKPKRILLVEDSTDVATALTLLLEDYGHKVAVAQDGARALAMVKELKPDLILLDIGLPGMDGFELAYRLQKMPGMRGTTMAALTGYGQASDRARAEAAGFDAHFVKPVDFTALEAFVNQG